MADSDFDFVYIHVPIPHPPVIYDQKTRTLATKVSTDYFSNLVLADQTLGALETVLVKAGMWDTTNVLVVGDHGLRDVPKGQGGADVRRVPFLLKLAGQSKRVDFRDEFDAIIVHDLVLMTLQGDLKPDEAPNWLRKHARRPNPPPGHEKGTPPGDIIECHDCA